MFERVALTFALVALLALAACAAATPALPEPGKPPAERADRPAEPPAPLPAAAAGPTASSASALTPLHPPVASEPPLVAPSLAADAEPGEEEGGFRPGEGRVGLAQFLKERGARLPARLADHDDCALRRVGGKQGLLCHAGPPRSEATGHSVVWMALLVLDGNTLREALSFPAQARALDFPEAIYATLRVTYDEQSGVLTLDDGLHGCEKATTAGDESPEYRRVVDRLCNARGLYQLKGSTFVRTSAPPPLRWPGAPRRPTVPPRGSSL
jgi:hypothetical protein